MPGHVPANVQKILTAHQQTIWLAAFEAAKKKYGEEAAYAIAMAAAKKGGSRRKKTDGFADFGKTAHKSKGPGGGQFTSGSGGGGGNAEAGSQTAHQKFKAQRQVSLRRRLSTSGTTPSVKTKVLNFVTSGQAKEVFTHAAKEHSKELLAGAVTFGLYHVLGLDFPADVEAAIHHEVTHFASNAGVAKTMAVSMMKEAIAGLKKLRGGTKDAAPPDDSDEKDGDDKSIDDALDEFEQVLEKLEQQYKSGDDGDDDTDQKGKGMKKQPDDDPLSDTIEDRSPHDKGDLCRVNDPGHPCHDKTCIVMGQHPDDPSKTRVKYRGKNPPQQTGSHKHKNLVTLKKATSDSHDPTPICVIEDMEFDDAAKMNITKDGYLACNPRVARTGIQLYKGSELDSKLDVVRVYRPPDEVFSPTTIKSFAHRPVTNDHPPENVNSRNWKKHSVGQTGDEVVRDGEFIRVPILMMDHDAIKDVQSGKRQLSAGYSANVIWHAGQTADGESYDAIQSGIMINHVALCKAARGGSMLCVGDSFSPLMDDDTPPTSRRRHRMERTITVDSVQLEMDDVAASVVLRTVDRIEGEKKTLKDQLAELSAAKLTHDAATAELKKQLDTKAGEIAVLKQQVADGTMTPQKMDEMVRNRMDIVSRASKILGSSFVTDGKTDVEIRRAVCIAKIGDAAVRAMNDDAINGAFSALTVASANDGSRILAQSFTPHTQPHSSQDAATVAYEERNKWLRDAYKNQRPHTQ